MAKGWFGFNRPKPPATERELEQIFRDAGLSNTKAKAAVSVIKGYRRDNEATVQAMTNATQEAKTMSYGKRLEDLIIRVLY